MPDRHPGAVIAERTGRPPPGERIGPIRVAANANDVATFAAGLGSRDRHTIPLTFPIRWLGLPEIRGPIARLCGAPPIHVSQSFDYARELATDTGYALDVTLGMSAAAAHRVTVHGVVRDGANIEVLRMESVLQTAIAGVQPSDAGRAASDRRSELPERIIGSFDLIDTSRYAAAAADPNPIHVDPAAARAAGLDGPVVHGMMLMGQFDLALREWFPHARVRRLQALFTRPVPVGTPVAIGGRCVPPPPKPARIVRLFARTGDKHLACVGEATLLAGPTMPAA